MNLEAGVSEVSMHPFGPAASGKQVLSFGTLPLLKSYIKKEVTKESFD
jgi:hypothetical protein